MSKFGELMKRLWLDQRGPTLLEYVGLAVLLIVAVWLVVRDLGQDISKMFQDVRTGIQQR
ncbi:MAG: Flp family type IVb pilin [Acidobacteriota bacterium]